MGSSPTDLKKHFHEILVQFPKGYFSISKPPLYLCSGAQIWLPQNCLERINFLCQQFCLWSVNKSQELLYAKYFSAKHLLHGRSATITQQSLIGYGFAATHVSLNLLIVRNKDFNGLHPDTIGKFSSLGLKFPRNKTDCPHCNWLYLLQGKKKKKPKNPQKF